MDKTLRDKAKDCFGYSRCGVIELRTYIACPKMNLSDDGHSTKCKPALRDCVDVVLRATTPVAKLRALVDFFRTSTSSCLEMRLKPDCRLSSSTDGYGVCGFIVSYQAYMKAQLMSKGIYGSQLECEVTSHNLDLSQESSRLKLCEFIKLNLDYLEENKLNISDDDDGVNLNNLLTDCKRMLSILTDEKGFIDGRCPGSGNSPYFLSINSNAWFKSPYAVKFNKRWLRPNDNFACFKVGLYTDQYFMIESCIYDRDTTSLPGLLTFLSDTSNFIICKDYHFFILPTMSNEYWSSKLNEAMQNLAQKLLDIDGLFTESVFKIAGGQKKEEKYSTDLHRLSTSISSPIAKPAFTLSIIPSRPMHLRNFKSEPIDKTGASMNFYCQTKFDDTSCQCICFGVRYYTNDSSQSFFDVKFGDILTLEKSDIGHDGSAIFEASEEQEQVQYVVIYLFETADEKTKDNNALGMRVLLVQKSFVDYKLQEANIELIEKSISESDLMPPVTHQMKVEYFFQQQFYKRLLSESSGMKFDNLEHTAPFCMIGKTILRMCFPVEAADKIEEADDEGEEGMNGGVEEMKDGVEDIKEGEQNINGAGENEETQHIENNFQR